jgi:hypothetical protein
VRFDSRLSDEASAASPIRIASLHMARKDSIRRWITGASSGVIVVLCLMDLRTSNVILLLEDAGESI